MKKIFVASIAAVFIFVFALNAYACEPCTYTLSLEDTIEQADLVIIGSKYGVGPLSGPENQPEIYGPDWISVDVHQVLKGEEKRGKIKVNSWTGMCQYGIVLENEEPQMIFLEEGDVMYDSVDWGCSLKALPVVEGGVTFEGARYSINELFPQSAQDTQAKDKFLAKQLRAQKDREAMIIKNVLGIFVICFLLTVLALAALIWNFRSKNVKKREK